MKDIVHIDLNAFFAQAECLRDRSLVDKPLAVGYDGRRGVVATCSYSARAFGVRSGMPMAMAKELCPKLVIVEGHYEYYRYLSKKFFGYLRKRYKILEQASIDECYIDMSEEIDHLDVHGYLFDLQLSLYRNTRLKCSIGYGTNKFLAKMGSDYRKPMGLTLITRENIEEILWPLPIEKMYGIGVKTAPKLRSLGIQTIGDLATTVNPDVRKLLGSSFEYYQGEANGFGDDFVDSSLFDPKSCSAERTFSEDITDYEEIRDMIRICSQEVSAELMKYHKRASVISIKLRDDAFRTWSRRSTLPSPIRETGEIFAQAMTIFDRCYGGEKLRLIGVGVEKVSSDREGGNEDR